VDRSPSSFFDRLKHLHIGISRVRVSIFALTLIVFGVALGGLERAPEPGRLDFGSELDLSLPDHPRPAEVPPESNEQQPEWEIAVVKPGQSLDAIFRNQGFEPATLHAILALNEETKSLKTIRPGDEFAFRRNPDGGLQRMRYTLNDEHYLMVEYRPDAPLAWVEDRQLSTKLVEAEGTIESSLFLAGKEAGLSDAMVMKLANIFGWDIDFILDIRAGDRFFLVYEKVFRDGQFLRDGVVVAATFVNQGERFQAVRYDGESGQQYYAPDGRPMRKAFLRAPLNFSYISSNFNPKRFHPILKRIRPHNGIDYRAPKGTPVYAAGDGHVIESAYSKYNGNYVFIQHANSIVTRYLHFSKRAVNKGERVHQGQVIGYVGATGLAQAPHLHYEFLVNGAHRNPRTVPLPNVVPLDGERLARFQKSSAPYLVQLSRMESASLYARSE